LKSRIRQCSHLRLKGIDVRNKALEGFYSLAVAGSKDAVENFHAVSKPTCALCQSQFAVLPGTQQYLMLIWPPEQLTQ
jgi:hypothetical protein